MEETNKGWEEESVGRRAFVTTAFVGSALSVAAGVIYPLLRYLIPAQGAQGGKKEVFAVPAKDVRLGEARFFTFKGKPAVMVRKSDTEIFAVSAVCTHLGCIVKFHEDGGGQFVCPCHGAKYDTTGRVLGGPAPKALTAFAVKLEGGNIVVEEA